MGKKIMIVDDEPDIVETLKTLLQTEGYDVLTAGLGKECLSMLQDGEKPDLIIMDFFMPEISGRETIEMIRQHPEYDDIKIIFFTVAEFRAWGMEEVKRLKISRYVQKPVDLEEFLSVIHKDLD